MTAPLTHLQRLEAESIFIMREVVAQATNPVMLYSVGKDSAVMLHLAKKAFYPAPPPFPLLHVDTTWKFQAMYAMRESSAADAGMELLVHRNPEAVERGINPFDHGPLHTDMWKTQGLRQALDKYGFDAAFGGARRDEEKARAKERVFSFRTASHAWDPKNQRPELWNLYNTRLGKGESLRVFPLSNWTELDIWQYIMAEGIEIVPLYFAAPRPTVERDGMLLMVDDDRFPLAPGEVPVTRSVRFRTLGCYPLTGAVESKATTLPEIIREMLLTTDIGTAGPRHRQRCGRSLDGEEEGRGVFLTMPADIANIYRPNSQIADDIEGYLAAHAHKTMLRFITCGSVDDGKSTLIGRMLYDTKMISKTSSPGWKRTASAAAPRARQSTSRCWWTDWRRSASRASPSTSPTAFSRRKSASSSSPIARGTSNIPVTWSPAHLPPMPPSYWSMRARAC